MAKFEANIIVTDVETGGLSCEKNPIVEIACLAFDMNLEDCGSYQSLIKQYDKTKEIQQQALTANGLTLEEIATGEDSKIVCDELIEFFKKNKKGKELPILCGHNLVKFDLGFIDAFFKFHNKNLYDYVNKNFFIDTLDWSHLKWQESANYKLGTCVENIGVSLVNAHRAMTDTQANKELVKEFIRNLRGGGSVSKEKRFREDFKFQF